MNAIREAWRRLGTPDAISVPAFVVSLTAAIIGNFVSNPVPISLWLRLAILLVGQGVLWLPLVWAWFLLRRRPEGSRPILVLLCLLSGLAVRALFVGTAYGIFVGPEHVKWLDRFVGALVNIGPAFVLTAVLVTAMRERKRQIVELKRTQAELSQTLDLIAEGFWERNEETATQVRQVLVDALDALDSSDASLSLATLQRTATEVVRPLSHELAAALPSPAPGQTPPTVEETTWLEILDEAAKGRPLRPVVTALVLGLELVGATVAFPPSAWWMATTFGLTIALLWLVNFPLEALLRGRSRGVRIASVVVAALVVAGVTGIATSWALGTSRAAIGIAVGMAFFSAIFSLGTVVVTAVARDRNRVINELKDSGRALERSVVRGRQMQWFQQKALSRALHGPVQVAVTAAALRLDAAIRADVHGSGIIDDVRSEIFETIDILREPELAVTSLTGGLERIVGLWDGVCSVTSTVDVEAERRISGDSVVRSCVIDIVSEAVSNAVRHGQATTSDIAIACDADDFSIIRILVVSDSRIDGSSGNKGLGTQLLDDCTLSWSADVTNFGYRLAAALPVA